MTFAVLTSQWASPRHALRPAPGTGPGRPGRLPSPERTLRREQLLERPPAHNSIHMPTRSSWTSAPCTRTTLGWRTRARVCASRRTCGSAYHRGQGFQQFQGHLAIEPRIASAEDLAEAALADLLEQHQVSPPPETSLTSGEAAGRSGLRFRRATDGPPHFSHQAMRRRRRQTTSSGAAASRTCQSIGLPSATTRRAPGAPLVSSHGRLGFSSNSSMRRANARVTAARAASAVGLPSATAISS